MEHAMNEPIPQTDVRELACGDRIYIRQGSRPIPGLVGQVGTVVELFRVPLGSCLAHIDSDPHLQREWFFYRDEITTNQG
jgi:hypothetical protein